MRPVASKKSKEHTFSFCTYPQGARHSQQNEANLRNLCIIDTAMLLIGGKTLDLSKKVLQNTKLLTIIVYSFVA